MRRTRLITSTSADEPPPGALLPPPTPRSREPGRPHPAGKADRTSTVHPDLPEAATKEPSHQLPPSTAEQERPIGQAPRPGLKAQGSRLGTRDSKTCGSRTRSTTSPPPHLPLPSPPLLFPSPHRADTSFPRRQEEDGRDHGHNERPRGAGLGRLTPLLPLLDGRTRGRTRERRATPAGRCSGPNTGHRAETGRIAQTTLDPPRAARDADARRGGQMRGTTIQPPSPHPLPPLLLLLLDGRTDGRGGLPGGVPDPSRTPSGDRPHTATLPLPFTKDSSRCGDGEESAWARE